jgi:hypothetical protein
MKILNAVEQEHFESPSAFNSVQRKQYFDFSSELLTLAHDLQTPTNQVCFLVCCGYFKATKRFFANRRSSRRDLDYVAQPRRCQYTEGGALRHYRASVNGNTREALDELLVQESAGEDEPIPAKTAAYKLTLLKKLSQSTKPSKIKETITDLLVVQGLYRDFLPILCALDLNHEGVRYYAHSVIKSEIFQVTRRSGEDRYLHLIAFITHQYFRLQDNLLDVLLNVLQTYLNTAQREHKEVCYRRREHWNEAVRKLIGYLDHSFLEILSAIKQITDSTQFDDAEKVRQIRAMLAAEEPDRHQAEASLAPLKRELEARQTVKITTAFWRPNRFGYKTG